MSTTAAYFNQKSYTAKRNYYHFRPLGGYGWR